MMRHMSSTLFDLSKRKHGRVWLSGTTSVQHKEKKKTKNYFLVSRNSQSAPTQWVMIRESLHALEDLKKSQKTEAQKKRESKIAGGGGEAKQSNYTTVT